MSNMMEQTITDVENLTKTVNFNDGNSSDVEAGIQFIYHMREHLIDIGIATIYGLRERFAGVPAFLTNYGEQLFFLTLNL
jgi:hypothetical protein